MVEELRERVYYSLLGQYEKGYELPGIENLFATEGECAMLYGAVLDAYGRLCGRLGVVDEDADVEIIISNLLDIQKKLCLKMFDYGQRFKL